MKIDLHVHTVYSGDSSISISELSKWCSVQTELDGIAITDHDTLDGYYRLIKSIRKDKELLIIPGIEISFIQGHILILNVLEEPKKYLNTIGDLLDYAKIQDGLVIIPHPYRFSGLREVAQNFPADAIEVLNPTASMKENKQAKLLSASKKLPGVAGSDAHDFGHIGEVFNYISGNSYINILESIKIGKIEPRKRMTQY